MLDPNNASFRFQANKRQKDPEDVLYLKSRKVHSSGNVEDIYNAPNSVDDRNNVQVTSKRSHEDETGYDTYVSHTGPSTRSRSSGVQSIPSFDGSMTMSLRETKRAKMQNHWGSSSSSLTGDNALRESKSIDHAISSPSNNMEDLTYTQIINGGTNAMGPTRRRNMRCKPPVGTPSQPKEASFEVMAMLLNDEGFSSQTRNAWDGQSHEMGHTAATVATDVTNSLPPMPRPTRCSIVLKSVVMKRRSQQTVEASGYDVTLPPPTPRNIAVTSLRGADCGTDYRSPQRSIHIGATSATKNATPVAISEPIYISGYRKLIADAKRHHSDEDRSDVSVDEKADDLHQLRVDITTKEDEGASSVMAPKGKVVLVGPKTPIKEMCQENISPYPSGASEKASVKLDETTSTTSTASTIIETTPAPRQRNARGRWRRKTVEPSTTSGGSTAETPTLKGGGADASANTKADSGKKRVCRGKDGGKSTVAWVPERDLLLSALLQLKFCRLNTPIPQKIMDPISNPQIACGEIEMSGSLDEYQFDLECCDSDVSEIHDARDQLGVANTAFLSKCHISYNMKGAPCWCCCYFDFFGSFVQKMFSLDTFGFDMARDMAHRCRENAEVVFHMLWIQQNRCMLDCSIPHNITSAIVDRFVQFNHILLRLDRFSPLTGQMGELVKTCMH